MKISKELRGLYGAIVDVYQGGNLFEGAWIGADQVGDALVDWAKDAWPDWYAEADDDPLTIEALIRDEEGPDELDRFLQSLSADLLRQALEPVRDELAEDYADDTKAQKLVKRLDRVLTDLSSDED